MSLAAVPLAVVLTVFTLTLTTPAATQETTTTPEIPDSNQPDNNCTFSVDNTTFYLADGDVKSVNDEVGTSFTWYLCEDGTLKSDTVSCKDTNQCADVTLGSIIDGNNTCINCNTLYENCPNVTETDSNENSNETESNESKESNESNKSFDVDVPSTDDDTSCAGPERGTDDCSRDPAYMFTNCCNFCYMQRLAPMSENSNDTLGSVMNNGGA